MDNPPLDAIDTSIWEVLFRSDTIIVGCIRSSGVRHAKSGQTGPWAALVLPRTPFRASEHSSRERYIDPTHAVLVGPKRTGVRQSTLPVEVIDWVAFEPSALSEILPENALVEIEGRLVPLTAMACAQARILFQYLKHCKTPDSIEVEERAWELLNLHLAAAKHRTEEKALRASTKSAHARAVEQARERIDAQLDHSITLTSLSAQVGYAPHHFCRIFRNQTGQTISQYVLRSRLFRALDALDADTTSYDLAARFGFSDRAHFSRHFSRLFGCSWQRMRQLLEQQNWSELRTIIHAPDRPATI